VIVLHETDEAVNVTSKIVKVARLGEALSEILVTTKVGTKAAQDLEELPANYRIDRVLDTIDYSQKVITLVRESGQLQSVDVDCNKEILTKGGTEIHVSSFE
jgi:hypothetical protein